MSLVPLYQQLLDALEALQHQAPELIDDADVRERISETLNWYWIWAQPLDADFPKLYGMYSAKTDRKLGLALRTFVDAARLQAESLSIAERHALLQPGQAATGGLTGAQLLALTAEPLPAEKPVGDWLYGDYDADD